MNWSIELLKPSPLSLIALALGVLLGAAFPQPGLPGLAWLIPGALALFHFKGEKFFGRKTAISSFKFGWLAGFGFWLFSLRWLLYIPFPSGALMGWLTLSAYLACYLGIWCWGVKKFASSLSLFRCSLFAASLWVVLEWVRGWFISGFAWNLLGVSQHEMSPLIQMVSYTGVYGLSFLMVAFSLSWVMGGYEFLQSLRKAHALDESRGERLLGFFPAKAFKEGLFWLLIVVSITVWGLLTLSQKHTATFANTSEKLFYKIALIQPSIPQTLLWDEGENEKRFSELLSLSREAVSTNQIDLLVWPEAALPGYIRYDAAVSNQVSRLAQEIKAPIVFCTDDVDPNPDPSQDPLYYNCAFLMNAKGELVSRYAKRHLVIFGEYVPLSKWLPFLKLLTPISGNYSLGAKIESFPWPTETTRIAPLICFEDVFPEEVREHVSREVSAFISLVNAGWFKESSAHWQHLANAQFRSIENRRPAIRSTQNGITCWIDRFGRVHDIFQDENAWPYGKGAQVVQIPSEELCISPLSVYQQIGNIVIWFAILWIVREMTSFYILRRKPKNNLKRE